MQQNQQEQPPIPHTHGAVTLPTNGGPFQARLKLMKPKPYGGSSQPGAVDNFIFDCEQYFEGMEVPDPPKQIFFAVSLLEGVAKAWWRFYKDQVKNRLVANIDTWEGFAGHLRARFGPVNATQSARTKLDSLKQTGSVRSYISVFQNLIMQIPGVSMEEALHRFTQGLQFRIKKEVALREPQTLEEAMRLAERYDALLYATQPFGRKTHSRATTNLGPSRPPIWGNPPLSSEGPSPMEVDAIQRRALTPEEKEHLRQIGGCFYCRKPGHIISSCPLRGKAKAAPRPTNLVEVQEEDPENLDSQ